jgi:hypothetical protein
MSIDTVDDLHAAEDEIGRLRHVLDTIHAVMCYPYEWSASTPEDVGTVLLREGYSWPDAEVFDEDEPDFDDLAPWRPKPDYCRPSCRDAEEVMGDNLEYVHDDTCGCPCHQGDPE